MSMLKAISALGAGINGFADGVSRGEEDKFRRDQQERTKREQAKAEKLEKDLAAASAPTEVKPVATMTGLGDKPIVFETPGDAAEAQSGLQGAGTKTQVAPGYSAGGKSFATMEDARKAAAEFNSDSAVARRQAGAYAGMGRIAEATQTRAAANQLAASDAQAADMAWRSGLGKALFAGHDGLANFVTQGQGDGLAAHRLKVVPSADGKTVTYAKVGEDGGLTPIPTLTFSNDQDGVIRAGFMLDRAITPEQRLSNLLKERELKNKEALTTSEISKNEATATYLGLKPDIEAAKVKPLQERMSEADKVKFGGVQQQIRSITDALTKAQADGTYDPTKPTAGVTALQRNLNALRLQQDAIINRYEGGSAASADPFGIRSPEAKKPEARGDSSGRVVPAETQRARDTDRISILNQELEQAKARLASGDQRASGDISAIERELALAQRGGGSRTTPKASMVAATAATETKPARSAASMSKYIGSTAGDRQFEDAAKKAGYTASLGSNGKVYFTRVVEGRGENLTTEQLAARLNIGL